MTQCQCWDGHCSADHGGFYPDGTPNATGQCEAAATVELYRIDMADDSPVKFCDDCAEDALESGMFTEQL